MTCWTRCTTLAAGTDKIVVDRTYALTDQPDKADSKGVEIVAASLIGGMQGNFKVMVEIDGEDMAVKRPARGSALSTQISAYMATKR